jgi:dienelactone hydrolase
MITRVALALSLMIGAPCAAAAVGTTAAARVPDAFLTFEKGDLVAVDWVERTGSRLHTRSILTQSMVIDATIELRGDGTAIRDSVVVTVPGREPGRTTVREMGEGAVYWSDMIPSSVEQAVLRARILGGDSVRVRAANLYHDTRGDVEVVRVDATDWIVRYNHKRYEVLTDESGSMLSATLPEFGVTIERRSNFRPEEYPLWPPYAAAPDGAYRAREVRIHAPQGHVLAGTLTTPLGRGPFPASVLITGLSPSNRNNGDPPWMPLRDMADALSRRGIAVLRVDDRGVEESTGDRASSTTFDEANDVETEVLYLRSLPEIDGTRIALAGYSEGGLVAPMVAARDSALAAIVTMAGPGVPGLEVGRYQVEAAVAADSTIPVARREAEIQKQLTEGLTRREQTYLTMDPLVYARAVRCPALIVQGGADLHVPLRSAERLAAAMRAGGNADVTVRIFPGVSHSLLPDPVGLNSGWPTLPGFRTSPEVLRTVAEWTAAKLSAGPRASTRRKRERSPKWRTK